VNVLGVNVFPRRERSFQILFYLLKQVRVIVAVRLHHQTVRLVYYKYKSVFKKEVICNRKGERHAAKITDEKTQYKDKDLPAFLHINSRRWE
jgi:hypothetical protein